MVLYRISSHMGIVGSASLGFHGDSSHCDSMLTQPSGS